MTRYTQFDESRVLIQPDNEAESRVIHDALTALHRALGPAAAEAAGAALVERGSMTLSIASRLPDTAIVLNHGFVSERGESLSRAAEVYRRAGVGRFFLSTPRQPRPEALQAAGLRQARSWRKFRRDAAAPVRPLSKPADIRDVAPGRAGAFARIASDAFDLGDSARPLLAALPEAPGWRVFQAVQDGEVAGVGALFVRDGFGWTDFGATRPECRGRGVQKALLEHRIRAARKLGCHTVLTCTGEAVPGEPQISYRNILALGFEKADLILNFAPA